MGTQITGGVDTHLEVHVAAALDEHGGLLGTASFATTPAGYRELVEWFASLGAVVLVGVEGTGSYGAGLTRHLQGLGIAVVEVDRPNRQPDAAPASPTPTTRSAPHEPRPRATRSARRSTAMASSRRSECYAWPATAPSETAPER
jgi:hypothetical protein